MVDGSFSVILEGRLFLGNQLAAGHRCPLTGTTLSPDKVHANFALHRITHVLCVTVVADLFPERYRYLSIPMSDRADYDIVPRLSETFDFISQALARDEGVFVHCQMGQSRSAAVVCAYLMRANGWPFRRAFDYMKEKRPLVSDEKFGGKLREYQQLLGIPNDE